MTIMSDFYERYHLYGFTKQQISKTQNCGKDSFYQVNKKICRTLTICTERNSDWLPVTIATLNVWNVNSTANESGSRRLKRLAKELKHLSLDIIGLQEVRTAVINKNQTVSQITTLFQHLSDYQFVFQPAMLINSWPQEEEGVALLSRYPIIFTNTILLPWNQSDPSDFHQRVCLHCKISIPKHGTIDVFVTHLSLSEDSQLRSVPMHSCYRYCTILHHR
jgi:endonuclease/exonuclease/phosphatase family metal-dependent hydrolase